MFGHFTTLCIKGLKEKLKQAEQKEEKRVIFQVTYSSYFEFSTFFKYFSDPQKKLLIFLEAFFLAYMEIRAAIANQCTTTASGGIFTRYK